ncbi:MAG: winged helix-turn-helix transcriptional regulator [Gammaproteobacteria bacterium]|nr:winged helix-turn-helix transcriptional regulator [Gammaproteobacteria bacterium]
MNKQRLVENQKYHCPVEATMSVIGGKWKCLIIHHLIDGTKRFNELRRLIPVITQRMLTSQLRELEADHIVNRKVYAEVPPKTEYSLTELGKTLEPVLWSMHDWGKSVIKMKNSISD